VNEALEPAALSDELLHVMRSAARLARELGEKFVSTRTLLLALLEDPDVAVTLAPSVPREKLQAFELDDVALHAQPLHEPEAAQAETPPMQRYDTLAFKVPESRECVWLGREAHALFMGGAERSGGDYLPKHLAYEIAAQAVRNPHMLAILPLDPGTVTDAIYRL